MIHPRLSAAKGRAALAARPVNHAGKALRGKACAATVHAAGGDYIASRLKMESISLEKALLAHSVDFTPSRLPLEGKLSPQATDEVGCAKRYCICAISLLNTLIIRFSSREM